MSVQMSPTLEANQTQADRVRRANGVVEPLLRQHSQTASGLWDLTRDEHGRDLLMSQLPDTDADFDDPADQPIDIKGEPLPETVIRERR